jgi:hypothetical protein
VKKFILEGSTITMAAKKQPMIKGPDVYIGGPDPGKKVGKAPRKSRLRTINPKGRPAKYLYGAKYS